MVLEQVPQSIATWAVTVTDSLVVMALITYVPHLALWYRMF
jgi:hypothetical protein